MESDRLRDNLKSDDTRKICETIQNNIGAFCRIAGANNCFIIDNNSNEPVNQLISKIQKQIRNYVNKPLMNPIGKQWIDNELINRRDIKLNINAIINAGLSS